MLTDWRGHKKKTNEVGGWIENKQKRSIIVMRKKSIAEEQTDKKLKRKCLSLPTYLPSVGTLKDKCKHWTQSWGKNVLLHFCAKIFLNKKRTDEVAKLDLIAFAPWSWASQAWFTLCWESTVMWHSQLHFCIFSLICTGTYLRFKNIFLKNGPFPASFSLFSSFLYSWQQTNVLYKTLPMAIFKPHFGSHSSNFMWKRTNFKVNFTLSTKRASLPPCTQ